MSIKVLVLGVNGFIGSSLTPAILEQTDWEIHGLDLDSHKIKDHLNNKRFHFKQADMMKSQDWIETCVKECDVILPFVAIATPATYVQDPLRIFELDFEANLDVIRLCVKHKKRVIFPSTSEVYGMCPDKVFDEETSNLVLGPINKQRWIYSCSKQLMDRIIYSYGEKEGLQYTLFRPFNWIGPNQDDIRNTKQGGSRVLTQFIGNILRGEDIHLVDGGEQRRCFTYIDDGIDALIKIIGNKNGVANSRIFNVGNPHNDYSIRELADMVVREAKNYAELKENAAKIKIVATSPDNYYGKGYQDVDSRVPNINNAHQYLDWQPKVDMETALRKTISYYFA